MSDQAHGTIERIAHVQSTGYLLPTFLCKLVGNALFYQEGILYFVLTGYPNLSHNFTNLVFVTSSLLFSVGVELKVK